MSLLNRFTLLYCFVCKIRCYQKGVSYLFAIICKKVKRSDRCKNQYNIEECNKFVALLSLMYTGGDWLFVGQITFFPFTKKTNGCPVLNPSILGKCGAIFSLQTFDYQWLLLKKKRVTRHNVTWLCYNDLWTSSFFIFLNFNSSRLKRWFNFVLLYCVTSKK